jgi:hypothetical protein
MLQKVFKNIYSSPFAIRVVRLRRLKGLLHACEKWGSNEKIGRRGLFGYLDVYRQILKWI